MACDPFVRSVPPPEYRLSWPTRSASACASYLRRLSVRIRTELDGFLHRFVERRVEHAAGRDGEAVDPQDMAETKEPPGEGQRRQQDQKTLQAWPQKVLLILL